MLFLCWPSNTLFRIQLWKNLKSTPYLFIYSFVFFLSCLAKHQNAENLFQIEPNSGIISLTSTIPPSIPRYVLNVTAYDDGSCCGGYPRLSSSSSVIIMIMDINNNNPTFPSCTYAPSVLENQPPGTRVVDVSGTLTFSQRNRGLGFTGYECIESTKNQTWFCMEYSRLYLAFWY